jgi:hypothetical protein
MAGFVNILDPQRLQVYKNEYGVVVLSFSLVLSKSFLLS